VQRNRPPSPQTVNVLRALAADPARRYSQAADLARDLRLHLANRPLHGVPDRDLRERWQKWRRRSPGELLANIALAHNFQYQIHATERRTTLVGFDFPAIMKRLAAEEKEPRTKDQTIEMLRRSGEKWAGWLQGLTDDFLSERVQMAPGMTPPGKCRFEMILSVKEHEMHHRGQLMLIERMIGVVPHLTRQMQERMAQAQQRQQNN